MENTITPTYKVSVTFNWHYADNSVRKIQKGGYITESGTQDEVVQKFLDTFMHSYIVGICKVEDVKVHRFDRILTVDEWMDKYNPSQWTKNGDSWTSLGIWAGSTYEQGAFTELLPRIQHMVHIVDWRVLQDVSVTPKTFTLHFSNHQKSLRESVFTAFYTIGDLKR